MNIIQSKYQIDFLDMKVLAKLAFFMHSASNNVGQTVNVCGHQGTCFNIATPPSFHRPSSSSLHFAFIKLNFIAGNASDRYNMQVSCNDLTVQHLAEYFAHRGGKGNLGNVLTAEVRAKISKAMTGKKHTAETCAKISKANKGRKLTAESIAARTGVKRTAETCAKISETKRNKKRK
jgi:hypothetical protein